MAAPAHQAQSTAAGAAGITATRLPASNGRVRIAGPVRWDQWWVEPALIVLVLGAFIVYSTWAALQNAHYYVAPYLSPFYSPCLSTDCQHVTVPLFGKLPALPILGVVSPAFLILWAPGGFRFPDNVDAAEAVRLAQESGEIIDPRAAEFFATTRSLAELLVERADLDFCSRVLEPSAGHGGIALAARERQPSAHIVCVEALEASAAKLRDLGFDTTCADFLTLTPARLNTYTHVLMNPPFSKRQDIAHVRHAFEFLEPGGVLVAIMSSGVKHRDDKIGREFRAFVEKHDGQIWDNPPNSFAESGTGVNTVMVRIRRPA